MAKAKTTGVEDTAPETTVVATEEVASQLLNEAIPERIDPGYPSRDFKSSL